MHSFIQCYRDASHNKPIFHDSGIIRRSEAEKGASSLNFRSLLAAQKRSL
jgi:hypothetical protein